MKKYPETFVNWYKKYFNWNGSVIDAYAHMEQFYDCWKHAYDKAREDEKAYQDYWSKH